MSDPFVYDMAQGTDPWLQAVLHSLPRLLLAGAALYGLTFCSRLYRTNKHLQAVNEHRRNALDTFPLVAESLRDPKSREQLLADLLRYTATASDTGFLIGGTDRPIINSIPVVGPAASRITDAD